MFNIETVEHEYMHTCTVLYMWRECEYVVIHSQILFTRHFDKFTDFFCSRASAPPIQVLKRVEG